MDAAVVPLLAGALASMVGAVSIAIAQLWVLRKLRSEQEATRRVVEQLAGRMSEADAWYWSPQWQAGEREADADLAAGRSVRFSSPEEMDEYLDAVPLPYATGRPA